MVRLLPRQMSVWQELEGVRARVFGRPLGLIGEASWRAYVSGTRQQAGAGMGIEDPTAVGARRAVRPAFSREEGFRKALVREVNAYFRRTGQSPYADRRMYAKTAVTALWFAGSYVALVFVAATVWQAVLSGLSLAFATAAVGFNVQHDANHGAYSKSRRVNHLIGLTLDLLGGSSYIWRAKHNVFHHAYTNIDGADSDIDLGPLARLSPEQPRKRLHKFQSWYLWLLYGFLLPVWHFYRDFGCLATGRIGQHNFPRPKGWPLFELLAGKLLFFGYALLIPMLFHPIWVVLLLYGFTVTVVGLVLSTVFQMAHCVEEAAFRAAPLPRQQIASSWSTHQVETTVNFACENRFLSWYLGGLNFQIEHHLFPRICHVHYPSIAPIVQKVCAEFGVAYKAHATMRDALLSHLRWLRHLGHPALQNNSGE